MGQHKKKIIIKQGKTAKFQREGVVVSTLKKTVKKIRNLQINGLGYVTI